MRDSDIIKAQDAIIKQMNILFSSVMLHTQAIEDALIKKNIISKEELSSALAEFLVKAEEEKTTPKLITPTTSQIQEIETKKEG